MTQRHKAVGPTRGDWAPLTFYVRGDLVTRQGITYAAKTSAISGSAFDAALWDLVTDEIPPPHSHPYLTEEEADDRYVQITDLPAAYVPPSRATATITTVNLAPGATATGFVTLAAGYRLLDIEANRACRVRLYSSVVRRTLDAARPFGTAPGKASGVQLDYEVTNPGDGTQEGLVPLVDGYLANQGDQVPYAITNNGTAGTITVSLLWIQTEAPLDVPLPDEVMPGPAFYDDFNRANGPLPGSESTSGHTWVDGGIVENSGAYGEPMAITDNAAGPGVNTGGALQGSYIETSAADGTLEFVWKANDGAGATNIAGPLFRYVDPDNYLYVEGGDGFMGLGRLKTPSGGGRYTYTALTGAVADGDTIRVVLDGADVEVFVNAVSRGTYTDNDFAAATKHGVTTYKGDGAYADEWSFEPA
jgi:hypothetical protein